ncbi:N-methylhydantoinase A/oxoprolinase/acetone carboxylase beta subunit [Desulfobaculum xiamenense]|uniref:N-methylhydantoinase A/oxoprolinase/acetone carboxylase beta subunit n=1 Tax=Desulfobaculum xiamenense TaxID=995050 RepID=A0A846QM37_9BACT|nr:hydantoinase/oxoprolinase family protein [Desulfobaculum xiamenense]NJB67283.1 N-methylhydantoinase A/oxoprolinase/acetone carboxylase beta subunit [Desulfobaculum xiamenense]
MIDQKAYAIGIDTGGTYTDAVLLERASGRVVASAKTPTTHRDLSIGLAQALGKIMEDSSVPATDVAFVSVSTTLATNAVVEDKGARVGLFVIGLAKAIDLPVVSVQYARGGHTITGAEEDPLDIEAIVDGVGSLRGQVDAYAVSAAMSFANPAHELVAAKAISLVDPKPVFCSHEVSGRAGIRERAATTVLHARLMPVMKQFIDGVSSAMAQHGLTCPVSVVRGDATPMSIDDSVRRAADTFASGPAATAYFGTSFAPGGEALVVDVGGTTTDVTLIQGGRPTIRKGGSRIGEWETHVEAVEMFTVGIGGDSQVRLSRSGMLSVGPARVLPLCMAGNIPDPELWLGADDASRLITLDRVATEEEIASDPVLSCLAENGPTPYGELMRLTSMGDITLTAHLAKLVRSQKAAEIGFTPTDALHVLDELELGDRDRAVRGARVLSERHGSDVEAFCREVLAKARHKIENAILDHIVRREVDGGMADFITRKDAFSLVKFEASLSIPIVGIGAPARLLLPQVAERLHTDILFPKHFEVGNALGAALLAAKAETA